MAIGRAPDGIEVWVSSSLDASPARRSSYIEWLSLEERQTHERFVSEALRDEHLITRALCRWVLSQYRPDVTPAEWRFERSEHGRPYVVGPLALPSFNLSHAEGFVVCAVSAFPVGVDVEPSSLGRNLLETAERVFSPSENATLAALDPASRARRAVELWTVKEAYLKARGQGISVRLDRFSVAPQLGNGGGGTRWMLEDVKVLSDEPAAWQLEVREVGAHTVAVAVRRGMEPDLGLTVRSVVPE
ncbi:MAG: 4-phosphopantetheinyl transferase superfamily protein [Labilithrix sp.]|nr:4-phosphopantetheinyl transferase superfamily protein [Labilithrix sp.]